MKRLFTVLLKYFKTSALVLLVSLKSYSQQFHQKIFSGDPSISPNFGAAEKRGLALDEKTAVISDASANMKQGASCTKGVGMVSVFKKDQNSNWVLNQELRPDKDELSYGTAIALNKNILAIASSPVPYIQSAVYIYKRQDIDSEFKLHTKILGDVPEKGSTYFHDVAINDNYVAIAKGNDGGYFFYKILPDTFLLEHIYYSTNGGRALDLDFTDNNLLVARYSSTVQHYKVTADTVFTAFSKPFESNFQYEGIEVDGNTVVHEIMNYPDGVLQYAFMKIDNDGNHHKSSDTIKIQYATSSDVSLKEDSLFFASFSTDGWESPSTINGYIFTNGNYEYKYNVSHPTNSTSVYGGQIDYSHKILLVGDLLDSSRVYTGPEACSGSKGKGSASMFSINKELIITGVNDSELDAYNSSLISPNPLSGDIITISLSDAKTIEIINASGISVKKAYVSNGKCSIAGLSKGVYMAKVSSGSTTKTERIVVE